LTCKLSKGSDDACNLFEDLAAQNLALDYKATILGITDGSPSEPEVKKRNKPTEDGRWSGCDR